MNELEIVITGADRSGLEKLGPAAKKAGKEIEDGVTKGVKGAEDAVSRSAKQMDQSFSRAGAEIENTLAQVEQEAWKAGRGTDKAFQDALSSVRANLKKVSAEAAHTGADLSSELGDALRSVREQAENLGSSVKKGGGGGGGLVEGLIGEIPLAKGGLVGAGMAMGAFLFEGLQQEWEENKVGALIAAQTGAAASSAGALGDIAGDTFANNFGESISDVGETMAALFSSNLIKTNAPAAAIQELTQKVLTLQTTTGETANAIAIDIEQMLVNGIAKNASQAMDIMQHATEKGLNRFGDLFDTVQEYSTSWREVGINGQEAMGLIEQATEAGARNTDIAADAIKEFGIRAQDASTTSRAGFQKLGLDADEMGHKVAQGGRQAHEALAEVLNRLQAMPPSVERSTAAVDLFGTKAEDMGDALYAMDLDSAAAEFGDFTGSVEEAAQKLSDAQSFWDKLGKGISNTANDIGEVLDDLSSSDDLDHMTTQVNELTLAYQRWKETGDTSGLDEMKKKYPEVADAIDEYIAKHQDEIEATNAAADANSEYVASLDDLINKQQEIATGVIDLTEAQIDSNQAVAEASAAMKEFAGQGLTPTRNAFDLSTEAGQKMQGSLNNVVETTFKTIEAMRQQSASSEQMRGYLDQQRQAYYNLATGMGISDSAAQALVNTLFGFPDSVIPVVGINDQASGAVARIRAQLDGLPPSKTTNIYINTVETTYSGPRGGHSYTHAAGGVVSSAEAMIPAAASGGTRSGTTVINEAGPEVVELPSGARVATAGATRAMGEAGWLGGGGSTRVQLEWVGGETEFGRVMAGLLRKFVRVTYGGDVVAAFGQG